MMKTCSFVAAASITFAIFVTAPAVSDAAELKVLCAAGMRTAMNDIRPHFERSTGHKLASSCARSPVIVKRILQGETGDVVIVFRDEMDNLVKGGQVAASDVTIIARAGMGVAVRKGAPKPDISTPEALRRTMLAAKSVTYQDPATGSHGGAHFVKVLELLGIASEVKAKTVFRVEPGRTGDSVASGEVQLVVETIQNLLVVDGIEIVGPLPGNLQDNTMFAAAVMARSENSAAAKALIEFLRTPEASAVIKAQGMDPVGP